eukprot:scaffold4510_cov321-Prasinococcus_capsulatus_cf.AAC.2
MIRQARPTSSVCRFPIFAATFLMTMNTGIPNVAAIARSMLKTLCDFLGLHPYSSCHPRSGYTNELLTGTAPSTELTIEPQYLDDDRSDRFKQGEYPKSKEGAQDNNKDPDSIVAEVYRRRLPVTLEITTQRQH